MRLFLRCQLPLPNRHFQLNVNVMRVYTEIYNIFHTIKYEVGLPAFFLNIFKLQIMNQRTQISIRSVRIARSKKNHVTTNAIMNVRKGQLFTYGRSGIQYSYYEICKQFLKLYILLQRYLLIYVYSQEVGTVQMSTD